MPVTSIILNKFKRLEKNPELLIDRKVVKVANIYVKRANILRGIRLALNLKSDVTDDEIISPSSDLLSDIISLADTLHLNSKELINEETKTLVLVDDMDTEGVCRNMNSMISPIVLSYIRSMCGLEKSSTIPPEYAREELDKLGIKLVIIPFSIHNRGRLVNYFVSLGLDIEVSMVSVGKELSDEIDFVNNSRKRANDPKHVGKKVPAELNVDTTKGSGDTELRLDLTKVKSNGESPRIKHESVERISRIISEDLGLPVNLVVSLIVPQKPKKRKK